MGSVIVHFLVVVGVGMLFCTILLLLPIENRLNRELVTLFINDQNLEASWPELGE